MMHYRFERAEYLSAIQREIKKRETTYPKMIQKQQDAGLTDTELQDLYDALGEQMARLELAHETIRKGRDYGNKEIATEMLSELVREWKMRKKAYPRWVQFKRLDPTVAEYELAVWRELCFWFSERYLGIDHIPPFSKRSHPIYP